MQELKKKDQPENRLVFCIWWSWRELNPRPQAFFAQFYMFSRLLWISLPLAHSGTL